MYQSKTPVADALRERVPPQPTQPTKETAMNQTANTAPNNAAAQEVPAQPGKPKDSAAETVTIQIGAAPWKVVVRDSLITCGVTAVVGGVVYAGIRYIPMLLRRGS
jgi:hypothetical protein